MPVGFIIILVIIDMTTNKKAKLLYFETEKLARLMNINVKDGMINIKKKKFFLDQVKPASIPSGILVKSFRPFYVVKWDKAVPLNFSKEGLKGEQSAENLKNLVENKTLDAFLRPKDAGKQQMLFFIIGAVMGGLIGYVLSTL